MPRYRRLRIEGGLFFFTLALADRSSDLLVRLVSRVADWPYSSFHRYVARGDILLDWAGDMRDVPERFGE